MIRLDFLAGHTVGVLGLGKAGKAAVASLVASGVTVYAWDDKASGEGLDASVNFVPPSAWPWAQMRCMVMSPGIPLTHPAPHPAVLLAQEAGVEIVGEVELLFRACPEALYVGITGTNGKSTTTALIGHILAQTTKQVQVGGNLGTPALALEPLGEDGVYVLEMSSYQLDLVRSVRFNVGCWLNITPDHLDRHGGMEGYVAAKKRMFAQMRPDDVAVIGVDDAPGREVLAALEPQCMTVAISLRDAEAIDLTHCVSLQGEHNRQNALVARAACRALGVDDARIQYGLETYVGLPHRMQWLGEKRGVKFVNDSKATNADSTEKALLTYADVYWILGGLAKAGGIEPLVPYFNKIRHAYVYGQDAEIFAKTLQEHSVPFTRTATMHEATEAAAQAAFAQGDGVVLLSPAAASFDQFTGFEQRGDQFMALVASL